MNGFIGMGAIAMTGFFLLSGYVINLSSLRSNMANPRDICKFYIKRMIAILPLYYTFALVNVVINIIGNSYSAAIEELMLFPIEILGIQSVFASLFSFSHNGGSWFISCILICYFVFPLLSILTKRTNDKTRLCIILVLFGILLWSPFVVYFFKCQSIYSNPFFRILEFTVGILVCQRNMKHDTGNKLILFFRQPWVCLLSVIALVLGVSIAQHFHIAPFNFMLYSWIVLPCFVSLLVSLGYLKFKRLQKSKAIHYLSSLSFSFFLSQLYIIWHTVELMTYKLGPYSNITNILLSFAICFCIANIYYFLIEKPSTKYLKSKLFRTE